MENKLLIEYVKLLLVFILILIIGYLITDYTSSQFIWIDLMRNVMGVFFIVFAIFQSVGYTSFISMFREYDPIAKKVKIYAYIYPFIGFLLGIFYLLDICPLWRDIFTVIILFVGAYGVWKTLLANKKQPHCACLGNVIKLPLSTVTLLEDLVMGTMAFIMILVQIL